MAESGAASEELAKEQLQAKNKKKKVLFIAMTVGLVVVSGMISHMLVQQWFDDIYKAYQLSRSDNTHLVEFRRIVVNIGGSQNQRILLISMTLEVASKADASLLEERNSQFLDMINTLTASKKISELSTHEGREELRNELLYLINERLQHSSLMNIYFSEYVIQ